MSVVDIDTLKSYFNTGDKPTEAQFVNLIDTLFDQRPAEVSDSVKINLLKNNANWNADTGEYSGTAITGQKAGDYYFTDAADDTNFGIRYHIIFRPSGVIIRVPFTKIYYTV
jgi:hypothetical protein